MSATIRACRWNDPPEAGDGLRILITRYRPRGVSKAAETWDVWRPDLAPSRELLALFQGKSGVGIPWSAYRSRYITEMRGQKAAIVELAKQVAGGEPICLLCSSACVREDRCHRTVLRELIQREVERLAGGGDG